MATHNDYTKIIKDLHSNEVSITACDTCSANGKEFTIEIVKSKDQIEILPANLPFANLIYDLIVNQHELLKNKQSYSILARCECFNVCDAQGNCHTECYICHTAPDVRCYGPFPYCPTTQTIFPLIETKDDSSNYISFGRGRLQGSVCIEDGFVYNNHSNRTIQVIYEKIRGQTSSQWVAYPRPRNREWLGCSNNIGYRLITSTYQ